MNIQIEIPKYENGLKFIWEEDYSIECKVINNVTHVKANAQGLVSLARHLLMLAQSNVPKGEHIHLDEYNSLEDDSSELLIEKI